MNKKECMMAEIDIENLQTQKVVTLEVPILKYEINGECVFDISEVSEEEMGLLVNAIDINLQHTDIELFYVEQEGNLPHFGPDFEFKIESNKLYGLYTRDKRYLKDD